jgi:hypothetical protein
MAGNALIRKELMTRFVHATHALGGRPALSLTLPKSLESSTEIDFKMKLINRKEDFPTNGFY